MRQLIHEFKHVYFIGIGGVGMSSLARILRARGIQVSGSDLKLTSRLEILQGEGVSVYLGQKSIHYEGVDLVVYSSAIDESHYELKVARLRNMNVIHRSELLAMLLEAGETSIGITGTHGKTTTSSMVSYILNQLGKEPTCLVGGDLLNFGTNALMGSDKFVVAEIDESDKSHERCVTDFIIMTNLEEDHMDQYGTLGEIEKSFERYLNLANNRNVVIYNEDDACLRKLISDKEIAKISFGFSQEANYQATNISRSGLGVEFDVIEYGFYAGRIKLNIPGEHNILNALAAIALVINLGEDFDVIKEALESFLGSGRRMEVKFRDDHLMVIDDYAHHPTEVKACLDALKHLKQKVTVVFQPHRYSRIQHFSKDFARVLAAADRVILTEVYAAGEKINVNYCSEKIYEDLKLAGFDDVTLKRLEDVNQYLSKDTACEGIIAFLGAGDIGGCANEFAARFRAAISA